ncbi:MAG: ParB/RepB/Spo0J family partition protein [Oscillospiraceae bacterium]|nr:ParB/RepB/Spo0J family partition protein [Oscillospiraceae bacterium]
MSNNVENNSTPTREQVQQIPISELHPFEGHPFRVVDDEAMTRTMESISQFGVISPLLARPDPDGGYEIISGHRRCHAAELVGLKTLPVIVREMNDDEAIIAMVDSNLQRETILPSERAWAYKMKLDAIKHQGVRTDLTSAQVGRRLEAADIIGQDAGESRMQVRRYIRLTNLIPELLDKVDEKKIAFNPAVELSCLTRDEQLLLLDAMDYAQATPSLSQAQRLKKMSQEGACTLDSMCQVMNEVKKDDVDRVTFKAGDLRKYFPKSYTPQQMERTIIKLLEQWQKRRQRDQSR